MPYARNPQDGTRVWFTDTERDAPVVVCCGGFAVPIVAASGWPLATMLSEECRVVWVDHRGMGQSDKPTAVDAYAMPRLVADVVAVLDEIEVERAHFAAYSWGACLGFAVMEHAPERLRSAILGGEHPYALSREDPAVAATAEGLAAARTQGIDVYLATMEATMGHELPEAARALLRENDPQALDAAYRAALSAGEIVTDLARVTVPAVLYAGDKDRFVHDRQRAAADALPNASFVSLPGLGHAEAMGEVATLRPAILDLMRDAA